MRIAVTLVIDMTDEQIQQYADEGVRPNGTAAGDSGLSPGALPPAVVPMWRSRRTRTCR